MNPYFIQCLLKNTSQICKHQSLYQSINIQVTSITKIQDNKSSKWMSSLSLSLSMIQ